jgi:hypothetical protein
VDILFYLRSEGQYILVDDDSMAVLLLIMPGALDTTIYDKLCQSLATGR